MAIVNEIVWRNLSTDAWVSFKAFGFLPLTFLFALAQMPLMQRYSAVERRQGPRTWTSWARFTVSRPKYWPL